MGQTFCRTRKAPGRKYSASEELQEASGDGDTVIPNSPAERRSVAENDGERGRRKERRQRRKKFWRRLCCIYGSPSRDSDQPDAGQNQVLEPEAEISDDLKSPKDIIVSAEDQTSEYFDCSKLSLGQIHIKSSGYLSEGEIVVPKNIPDAKEEPVKQDILSKYTIGYKLGEGGFGCVNAAFRLADNLSVAVKIADKRESMEYINIPDHPTPVPLEVGLTLLANTGPPSSRIIQLLDWQDDEDKYIMVLQRPFSSMDLRSYFRLKNKRMNEDKARRLIEQVIDAAITCCNRGVLHRDIKLENILVNTITLDITLIDFGCGALLHDTPYYKYCGTAVYCPPEFFNVGKYFGKPATVYSLGVLLFYLVCGHFPKNKDRKKVENWEWRKRRLSKVQCLSQRMLRLVEFLSPSQPQGEDSPRRAPSPRLVSAQGRSREEFQFELSVMILTVVTDLFLLVSGSCQFCSTKMYICFFVKPDK
ncbi:hypothetical protein DNTS_033870 [Danionella cerebrum]|uniref:non-specific serine/threonine protein kinase n=1 Tax=Danionella cerebrum TaxID=2873325 RepID=A0A553NGK7_9TELE|nr:hypothetical protein DNTS_033870 [Danionella translucida]